MKKRWRIAFLVLLLVAVLVGAFLVPGIFKPRPNVIFITLDSLRSDHLSCYGYKRATSPNIDALSRQGVLFSQAISQSSWTAPSVSSILTSLYPNHLEQNDGFGLGPEDKSLLTVLKSAGYKTYLFGNSHPILSKALEGQRDFFDVFDNALIMAENPRRAAKVVNLVNNNFPHKPDGPFFLWVYFYDTHAPYVADSAYADLFYSDDLYPHQDVPLAPQQDKEHEYFGLGLIPLAVAKHGITDTSYYISRYDGAISSTDEQVGRLLEILKQKHMLDNTLVVLFSDHGESLTEHNFYFSHSYYVYDSLIRVSLMMVLPGKIAPAVIPQQVQMIDLMPTVLQLLGIKRAASLEGVSRVPLMEGRSQQGAGVAFSETSFHPHPQSIRTAEWKLIHNTKLGNYELYNLKADPGETNNLVNSRVDIFTGLRTRLSRWVGHAQTFPLYKTTPFTQDEKKNMRALGYLQ